MKPAASIFLRVALSCCLRCKIIKGKNKLSTMTNGIKPLGGYEEVLVTAKGNM